MAKGHKKLIGSESLCSAKSLPKLDCFKMIQLYNFDQLFLFPRNTFRICRISFQGICFLNKYKNLTYSQFIPVIHNNQLHFSVSFPTLKKANCIFGSISDLLQCTATVLIYRYVGRAGHAITLPRQSDHVCRPQSCWILHFYYIRCGNSIQSLRP